MNYYYLEQDKKISKKYIRYNSMNERFFSTKEITEVAPITIYDNNQIKKPRSSFPSPKYSDIISGAGYSVYSDRMCEVLKELNNLFIRPAKLIMNQDGSTELGYNLVLRAPTVECKELGVINDEQFEIDESLFGNNLFFDLRWRYGSFRVINKDLKGRFENLNLSGVHMIPIQELNGYKLQELAWGV